MAEDRQARRSALAQGAGSDTDAAAQRAGPRLGLSERRPSALVRLCAPAGDDRPPLATGDALRANLPMAATTVGRAGGRTLFWTGPGEWLVVAANEPPEDLVAALRGAISGATIVDLSHARTVVRIGGAAASDLIATGCPLEIGGRGLNAGACAQTIFAGMPVLVHWVPGDAPAFDLYVPRSYGRDLWDWLCAASAAFADPTAEPGPA